MRIIIFVCNKIEFDESLYLLERIIRIPLFSDLCKKSVPLQSTIKIHNASENNLRNISLEIPKYQLVVVTGVSGSGKSSLVYDVIFREAENRYLASFSSHARQFMGKMKQPEVEKIDGLSPSISINQKTVVRHPRSTVGTLTGIYDYLRLIFARFGESSLSDNSFRIDRKLFSFNHPVGACENCHGLGLEDRIAQDLLIEDPTKSLREGALVITTPSGYIIYSQVTMDVLNQVCEAEGFNVDIPWQDLSEYQKQVVLYGSDKIEIPFGKHTLESRMRWSGITAKPREIGYYKGIIPVMEEILKRDRNKNILRFTRSETCSVCEGKRLNQKALSVKWQGRNIAEFASMSLRELEDELKAIRDADPGNEAVNLIIEKILYRTSLLDQLGASYLELQRESTSLSGGESQRLRLATQVNAGLREVLYIFDEPSIGLHPSENKKMIGVLKKLRDHGNTILVVEHDDDFIRQADHLIDLGPGAGSAGGEVLLNAPASALTNCKKKSLTLDYLLGRKSFHPLDGNKKEHDELTISGAREHNLDHINVRFKLQAMNVISGVSGSGKSTLADITLGRFLLKELHASRTKPGAYEEITGWEKINKLVFIDQSPIGRTPRSNPATYTKLFDLVRNLFASLPAAKAKGWGKGRFSFNVKGGRCEACQGAGYQQIGMHFMGNVEILCEHCNGQRFNEETLEIRYKGLNIYEILELPVEEALRFFSGEKKILRILEVMHELGLGYIRLGQRSTTLSGGEAQRVKLATELARPAGGHVLYLLDEPTTGLHNADVEVLLQSLRKLVARKHTVLVIEHHPGLIVSADHIVDLGPGSGKEGGRLVFQGSFKKLLECKESRTAASMIEYLQGKNLIDPEHEKHFARTPGIRLQGVTTNNLKNISTLIPDQKLSVLTGLSGSGKSSLAFDTLYAEGRNRFLESYSAYVRNRIGMKAKADFEEIRGLTPVMAIKRAAMQVSARSTVGTISGIYEMYRLLLARAAVSKEYDDQPTASMFSFNHEQGACRECDGLGHIRVCDPDKLITVPTKPLIDGAMDGTKTGRFYGDPNGQYVHTLLAAGERHHIDYTREWQYLGDQAKEIALYGTADKKYDVRWKYKRGKRSGEHNFQGIWKGFARLVEEEYLRKHLDQRGEQMMHVMKDMECPACRGSRLNERALSYRILGKNIAGLAAMDIRSSIIFFEEFEAAKASQKLLLISRQLRKELLRKLKFLQRLGLDYLQINRRSASLSGGEAQRLQLASQLTNGLSGMTYVLDEPSIGLHTSDLEALISVMHELKAMGNTLLVVEHDAQIIREADYIIELGPGAGKLGGEITAEGSPEEIKQHPKSLSAKCLENMDVKPGDGNPQFPGIIIKNALANNLKIEDLHIPVGAMVCVSGVSGSGKSSLLFDVIAASALAGHAIGCSSIQGLHQFDQVLDIKQEAMSTSSVSNAATLTGVFDQIRDIFASTTEAREQSLKKSHFSFNTKGGRCEDCQGKGYVNISLDFLTDVRVSCESCHGKRYTEEILKCRLLGKSILDVLELSVTEALDFFREEKQITAKLEVLAETGLGYIQLGQQADSLSGGEAQRLKIARQLIRQNKGKQLFLFDEPGTGLHFKDVEVLMKLFRKLTHAGHSILLIEHDPAMILQCDWLIDLGPGGGDQGGQLVAEGSPIEIAEKESSLTGKVLKKYLM